MEDKQTGSVEQQRGTDEGYEAPPPPLPLEAEHAEQPRPDPNVGDARGGEQQPPSPPTRWTRFSSWFNPEHMNVLLTAVIAITGVVGIILVIQAGEDTKKMIRAAQQQACAASSFAESADSINQGVGNAASQLAQQVGDNESFFRTDERAWVVISSIEKTLTIPPDPPFGTIFKFSIFPKNVGKTVARNVRIHAENPNASASFMENRHAIIMSEDQLFHLSGSKKRAIMPDNPGPQTLAPGAQSPVPVFSGGQEPQVLSDGNYRYSFILGRIDYIDAFGVKHWTHFCYFIENSRGELANCTYGNDQDSNPAKIAAKPN